MILQHHERLDGSGYSRGTQGRGDLRALRHENKEVRREVGRTQTALDKMYQETSNTMSACCAPSFRAALSLLMLDIDHFKRVNDAHGHQAGDAILRGLGNLLMRQARAIDRVCRYEKEMAAQDG